MAERQAFDKTKDKPFWEVMIANGEKNSLKIGKYSYDGAPERLGVVRVNHSTNREGAPQDYFNPLGRFTVEEFMIISQAISEKEGI